MPIKNLLKKLLIDENLTITELLRRVNERHDRKELIQNFDRKINSGTMKFDEAEEVLDVLGYELVVKKKSD